MIEYEKFFSYKDIGKSYSGWRDHVKDHMIFIDMACRVVLEHRRSSGENAVKNPLKGIIVTSEEAEVVFSGGIGVPDGKTVDVAEKRVLIKALRHISSREDAALKNGVFLPLQHVAKVFSLSVFEKFCMVMGLILELDRKYEKVYGYLHDNASEKLPTVGLAAALYGMFAPDGEQKGFMPSEVFFKYILDGRQWNDSLSRLSRPMRLNEKIFEFLIGKGFEEDSPESCPRVEFPGELPEFSTGRELQDKIRSILENLSKDVRPQKTALCLYGPAGSGKRFQVRYAAKHLDMPVVWVDGAALRKDVKKLDELVKNILRKSIVYQGILCIYNFHAITADEGEGNPEYAANDILSRFEANVDVLFILSETEWKHGSGNIPYTVISMTVEVPDDGERLELWKKFTHGIKMESDIDLAELSNKFYFTVGMIEKAVKEAALEADICSGGVVDKDILYRACIRQSAHRLEKKATKVKPAFTWDDLILPEEQKRMLFDACNHIKYRHIVLNQWGFDKKLPYGRGLGILFYGPPGTGKTMGAQVMANELKLEIYRIDLSQTVSKYIGETEKNLKEIFDEAARTSAILFFDEADSLFGKRSEMKDAHDRYANLETSYLLQKMEEYEGITILATNLLQNFDEAYRRRFKFLINFPMPDAKTRKMMWEGVFPEKLPLEPEVDLDFMAEQFELSGSNIKNIAVAASFLAAGEGSGLKMKHLVRALKNELTKAGKVMVKHDLGGYGDLL